MHSFVCVCSSMQFITFVASRKYHQNQYTEQYHQKSISSHLKNKLQIISNVYEISCVSDIVLSIHLIPIIKGIYIFDLIMKSKISPYLLQ